ncbi:MAG: peptide chain release factor N(5)-glutamine methyltransferase [Muribaculaceae bacterium]|nr:peptide chain release factor N(5)-glutamine methyltransferase [Muribaculaceae bacterium]
MTPQEISLKMQQELCNIYDSNEISAMTREMMTKVLSCKPVDIVMRYSEDIPDDFSNILLGMIERLKNHEPLQYILGVAHFHGHDFKVTPAVLIPRPETAQLVDMIVDENPRSDLMVLDIGTGSGCIAISLSRALKFAQVTGIDLSARALEIAEFNNKALNTRVKFVEQDILTCRAPSEAWDIIVSNPPYITESEKASMERNVLDYEPEEALFVSDDDPMLFYRPIATYASRALKNGGRLYLEINRAMASQVVDILQQAKLRDIQVHTDFYGNNRFVTATKIED